MTGPDDPTGRVDALISAAAPGVAAPGVHRSRTVLVTGPWLAGVSAVAAALRVRLPDQAFVEAEDLASTEAPTAVVFVVSAAAAITESDCTLLDAAATRTDPVIGVISKIDVHRHWPQLLRIAADTLGARAARYRDVPWIGVAAAPEIGSPRLDDLVAELRRQLDDPAIGRRNRLRLWEFTQRTETDRYAHTADRRTQLAMLAERRADALHRRCLLKSERTMLLRSRLAQARVQLSYFARKRCSAIRGELREEAAEISRRQLPRFEHHLRCRLAEVVGEVEEGSAEHLAGVAAELGLTVPRRSRTVLRPEPELAHPVLKPRQLEDRLMLLLGAGFGLTVALTLIRIFTGLAPGLAAAGALAGAVAGLGVTVWTVAARGLLRDRAMLDRRVGEATGALRSTVEELVALQIVAAESAFSAELNGRIHAETARVDRELMALECQLREHVAATRATALVERQQGLLSALELVRAELAAPTNAPQDR